MAVQRHIASNDDDLSDGVTGHALAFDGVMPVRGREGRGPDARARGPLPPATIPVPDAPMVQRAMAGDACLGCPAVEAAFRWMLEDGRLIPDLGTFVTGVARQLADAGFPLLRFFVSVRTLHPQIAAIGYAWKKGDLEARRMARDHAVLTSAEFMASPLRILYQGEVGEIRRRLTGPEAANDFPILDDLRKEGATDYAIFAIRLPGGVRSSVSITSDAPGGFTEAQMAAFRTLIPLFSLIIEAREWAYIARSLMHVYLGNNAGESVLSGQIQRGDARTIAAAIWYCDLRGFTQMSNELPRDLVIATLNDYFDTMARPVIARGGEILKFIGDAMLAIFPMQDDLDRDGKCRVALDAAIAALDGLRDLNELRSATGQPPLKVGIGLHAGSVSYGNIGAAQGEDARLDFTVIGPAVNLATRIETLCPVLDEPLLASKQFASICGSTMRPLGAHPLRGFAEKQEVYGLPR